MSVITKDFGENLSLVTITLDSGFSVSFTQLGASIVNIMTPDKNGVFADVVQGYDHAVGFINGGSCQGAIVGRFANRIGFGRFTMDGVDYQLAQNAYPHHLHGGDVGYHKKVWTIKETTDNSVTFSYFSEDGEENYPGNLTVNVCYTVENDAITILYTANTDKKTPVNFTNHAYFNLSGDLAQPIYDHELMIKANHITAVNELLIPTGEYTAVENTPYNFNQSKPIGQDILNGKLNGYDHNFIVGDGKTYAEVAQLYEPTSGRVMTVFTDKPGLQIYTANGLDEIGKGNAHYKKHSSVCLETQYFPDSPNHANFPFTFLSPEETYQFKTTYQFSVRK